MSIAMKTKKKENELCFIDPYVRCIKKSNKKQTLSSNQEIFVEEDFLGFFLISLLKIDQRNRWLLYDN